MPFISGKTIQVFGPKITASFVVIYGRDKNKLQNDKQQSGWLISPVAMVPGFKSHVQGFTPLFFSFYFFVFSFLILL